MRLKLTLARQSGQSDDIVVTTDAVATVADVAAAIRRLDPKGQEWAVGGEGRVLTLGVAMPGQQQPDVLSPDIPIGEAQIGDGATVLLADATSYGAARAAAAQTVARLRILTGPAVGTVYQIPAGSTTIIGRDASCDIVIADPFVSGRHARIHASGGIELVDLGSANGLVVDGGIVDRLPIRQAVRVLIGDTEVEIVPVAQQERPQASLIGAPGAAGAKAGPVLFNRSPKVETRYVGAEFEVPEVPQESEPQPIPLIALATPVLMAGVMYMITQQVASVAFAAMSPLMVVGNWFMGKRQRTSKLKRSVERFDAGLDGLTATLGREREKEAAQRARETPSTEEVYDAAVTRKPLLWTRRPEHWSFLNVRLGVGAVTSRNTIDVASRPNLLVEFQDRLDAVIETHRTLPGVPITENLYDAGAIGIAGDLAQTAGVLNALLVQLTGLHSPAELTVAAIVSSRWSREVEWLKWMPHSSSVHSPLEVGQLADSESSAGTLLSNLEGLIAQRLAERRTAERRGAAMQKQAANERGANVADGDAASGTRSPIPAVVVVVSDDAPVDRGRLIQLAESAADAGVFPIWVSPDIASLPAVCRSYLAIDSAGTAEVGFVRLGEHIADVVIEPVDGARAQAYAHLMAPVVDAGAPVADASDLPRSISLVTLLGHDLAESAAAVVDRWKQNDSIHDRSGGALTPRRAGKLRAIVGSGGHDPMHLDLRTQGPHALVGGTTGAGKSEFLQAWVLGMAAEYSPDRVTFLFVDYKGGSAFADCVQLPHCVGLVTDLSPHLVRRALTSLRAELHHREHLFNRKKAKDLLELEKRGDADSPPALVLVIDEFAALAGEVPEFVDGVVDIAQRGRSLGIHLIMATQRPAGVIKDNLRANTNLRVALRMADESDSQDVIGVKDSAHVDPAIPGRGYAKTGPGRLAGFQSAYAGGWTTREPERADIQVAELRFGGENRWEDSSAPASVVDHQRDLGPNDQQRLVQTMIGAHRLAAIPDPRRPWLDELAPVYDLSKLRQRTDAELLLGVADVPEQQEQTTQYFRPDADGHLAVFGTSGSGKTTVLRTVASAAAITPRGGPVHVYGLDYGAGSLRILDRLPHVGAIVAGEDTERVVRLFRTLQGELVRRAAAWAEVNASSIAEYRQLAGRPGEPRILLLIDNFTNFKDDFEVAAGRAQWYDVFRDVLADGRRLGIHVALTADRAGAVPTSIAASIQRRVVLRLADDGYGALGVPSDILGPASVPGRAIVDGHETQIAILGGTTSVSEQGEALGRLAEAMGRAGVAPAPKIGSLPKEYTQSSLPASVGGQPVLGLSDLDLGPYSFEPSGTVLLAGPPASGRTTALQTIATALLRTERGARAYYFGNARSALARLELWADAGTDPDAVATLARDLLAAVTDPDTEGRIGIFVETVGDFLQTPADGPLVELIKAVRRSDHLLVAEGETSAWGSSWPLFGEVKNGRRGILLQPEAVEGDILLKTALPRMARSEFPPGRGVYIARGQHVRVQLPLPG
ncbi:FtsK/SpoIIIE domain-containing protein [Gryllotalpicola protaetiae]|uniref:FHA domain-containing protein n=1 Tax=Gryllotalpicola protaetiae TaxID=2419771 RepID=A0A387BQ27_9MICO|nr:FtsK/SpoIIIE domain-containing protein [Gryllotalpicola protaetiae]AYG03076.1 FHA domain-containing protein [Gryllotalpicola protaetiae]